jgi:Fe2+ or Zn2+ uptake regulation protein
MGQLKNHGYRLTGARNAVVETVADAAQALTPLEVYDLARRKYAALGLVTVYRTLEKLEELHLVQRVHQPAGCQAFIAASRGHQHLLLCQSCGQAIYIDGDNLDPLIDKLSRQTGFRIDEHWLQFFGLCTNCK